MGEPISTAAAVVGGSQVLGGLLGGGGSSSSTTTKNYKSTPVKYTLKNGQTITLYDNLETGSTTETESNIDFGDALANALTSAGEAYAMGSIYDKVNTKQAADAAITPISEKIRTRNNYGLTSV